MWQRGVRRIEGRVIGDGSAFGGTSYGEGWQWDDLPFSYAAPVSALTYNENTAEFVVAPGPSAGALAQMTPVDGAADLEVVNRITTVASGTARRLSIDADAGRSARDDSRRESRWATRRSSSTWRSPIRRPTSRARFGRR